MSWKRGAAALLLMAAGLGALPQPAAAQDAVRLELPDCAGVSGETVRGLVALEVAPRPVLAIGSAAPATTRAALECEDGVARIVVEDIGRPAPLRLDLALAEHVAAARPRLLALAIAELIATSRLERPQPVAAEEKERTGSQPTAAESSAGVPVDERAPPSFQLWLAAAAVREAEPAVLAPSIALGAVQSWGPLAIVADLRYERGRRTEPEVRLGLDAGSLGIGPAWRLHGRSYQLLIGPAARVGYARLRGEARTENVAGDTVDGFWFGPCVQLSIQLRIAARWALRVGAELGYVTRAVRGVDASGERLLDLGGVWASAQLGMSFDVTGAAP